MPVVNEKANRFQFTYDGLVTVIEGSEFDALEYHFRELFEKEINRVGSEHLEKGSDRNTFVLDMLGASSVVCLQAFQAVWGYESVYLEELEELSTPDARKMDLFYKGKMITQVWVLQDYKVIDPELDAEELFGKKKSIIESLNDVFILRPSLFGIGLDINVIIKKHLESKA
ncbi:MAG: hypothetical protein P9E88_14335 [Candidatus Competibacter sp.]|jgi:hypothetical protein|nr:hypothetical protein [Candidatus Competibacter sp.]